MITLWTQHLSDDKEKENFEVQVRRSVEVLDRLTDICKDRLSQIEKEEEDFSAGWEYKQASLIGRRLELKRILKLLDHRG